MNVRTTCWIGLLVAGTVTALAPGSVRAGQFNRVLSIGDAAPEWNDLPGVDGKNHSSSETDDAAVTVVAFTCNSCPYAVDAEPRLVALAEWLAQRDGRLIAINVNTVEEDLMPAMIQRAKEAGFKFPYLIDTTQEIATKFGATTTPEFFVLDSQRRIRYMGSLDDSPDGKRVTEQHVRGAVEAVLQKKDVQVAETVPIGCRIRFERKRRGR
jgi:peroxiredoxin